MSYKDFLREYGISHYAAIAYENCREINPHLRERLDFVPKTAIIFLVPYYAGDGVNISSYATSLDYHIALREISDGIISHLGREYPDAHFVGYGDHSPINEVGAAIALGLGVLGDNGLIINSEYGSYVFIGDVITDISPELLGARDPQPFAYCEHCGACRRACPTGILRGEGGDCLSAITQRKGELTECERELMRKYNTAWGCDECQSVCPHNRSPRLTPVEFFRRERIENLTSDVLEGMTRVEFSRRAFAWRGRKTVERNLDILNSKS